MPYRRKGSAIWYIRIKGVRASSGTTVYEDAKALEDRLNHEAWLNEKMGIKPPRSWDEATVMWLNEKQGKKSYRDDVIRLRCLRPYLGSVADLNKINRDMVHEIMLKRGASVSQARPENSTANKYVGLIGSILRAAEGQWGWGNSVPRLRKYQAPKSPGKALKPEEWRRLERELPDHLRRIATFAVATGLRMEKVYSLQWNQLDLEKRSLTHDGTENKLGNTIPLNDTALSVLKSVKADKVVHQTHVFTFKGKPMKSYGKSSWRGALERAGLPRIRFHDLRHTFNSWLFEAGVEKDIRKRLVGHSTGDTHDRYTHMSLERLLSYSRVIDSVLSQAEGKLLVGNAVH